jgi:hypothetical protein
MTARTSLGLVVLGFALAVGACSVDELYVGSDRTASTGSGTGTTSSAGTGGAPVCTQGMTQPCYDGPAGTEGVGICTGGTQTCAADGQSWGPCVGEVTPQTEMCGSGLDQNCDGAVAPPCVPTLLWAEEFGEVEGATARGVAADTAGDVVVTGAFFGSVDFGGGALVSDGTGDIFVTKLHPTGNYFWAKGFGGGMTASGNLQGMSVAVDSAGNAIVTGTLSGSVDFGGGPLTSNGDIFVAKLDPGGNYMWAKQFGSAGTTISASGIAVDGAGDAVLAGNFWGAVNFGGATLMSSGDGDAFVVRFDAGGNYVWAKHFGSAGAIVAASVAMDSTGDAVMTGGFSGPTSFGSMQLTTSAPSGTFVAKLDANGTCVWAKSFSGTGTAAGTSVAMDSTDYAIVAGNFSGTVSFGGADGPLTSAGGGDMFVAKLDPNGGYVWATHFGSAGNTTSAASVAVDGMGSPVMTGNFSGSVDFGGGPLTSSSASDMFLAKLTAAGAYIWARQFGSTGTNILPTSVAVDSTGDAVVIGNFSGAVDFGSGQLMGSSARDMFIAEFSQ